MLSDATNLRINIPRTKLFKEGVAYAPIWLNRNTTIKVRAGTKKLPPRRFSTVGIVPELRRSPTQPPHKHHHHGGAVCPSYGVVSLDAPDRTRATSSEGVGQELYSLV
jgi:hypothetical protein